LWQAVSLEAAMQEGFKLAAVADQPAADASGAEADFELFGTLVPVVGDSDLVQRWVSVAAQ
jgi:hypothetical protein